MESINLRYIVPCRVIDSQGKPIIDLRIQAFDQDPRSPHDPLGEAVSTNSAGIVEFRFNSSDYTEHPGEEGPDIYFKIYRANTLLQYTLPRDKNDQGVMRRFKPQREPITIQVANHCLVEGRVLRENGLPAPRELELFIYNRAFGGRDTLLGKPKTDENGYYALVYDPGAVVINLEIRIKDPQDSMREISLAKTKFRVSVHEVLNLVVPSAPLKAEYRRLEEDLRPHILDMSKLVGARENTERQDLTVLNRATGWDARLIALAARAVSMCAEDVGLSQEALYGLFRAGLPTDKLKLGCINPEVVGQALVKAKEAGIIGLNDEQIKEATTSFQVFARGTRLAMPAPGSNTTYEEMLGSAGLGANLDEAGRAKLRAKFAEVYLNHGGDAAQLWEKASDAGICDDDIKILQLQGKLSFLTLNSGALTTHLQKEISNPVQLVDKDFYQAAKWRDKIKALAGNDVQKLQALIPPAFTGETAEDRLNAYTEDMARKVRMNYSTEVIARMLEKDTANDFKLGDARVDTAAFLKNAAAKGFKLGQTPVEAFIKSNFRNFSASTSEPVSETTKRTVKALTCVYQITPSNEAMQVLFNLGFSSAHDIVAIPQDDFLKRYGDKFPSQEQAELVYRKAKQVDAVTHNLFTIAKKLDSEAPVHVISASVEVKQTLKNEIITQFPTMESLFGSLDFCECEHCRSVLSPAAYFVDLLQFLDKNAEQAIASDWNYQMTNWPGEHGGAKYPFKNKEQEQQYLNRWREKNPGNPDPNTQKTPYEVLIERRPDLPQIPLTCENTQTALPYIDVVNEILEYYVANDKLEEKAARDTGSVTTEDLLAEPANVITGAYTKLQQARYPLSLPFDLWLETVRRFSQYFETPLWQLMEVFRSGDELFVPTQSYDRAAILAESLGLSLAEYSIFTNPKPLDTWYELYGYKSAADATTVNSAKALSRRLGVSYKELAEIVQTGFVNPKLETLVVLHKLGVSISNVVFYKSHKNFYTANRDLLGKARSALSAVDRQRFDKLTTDDWQMLNELKAFEQRLDELSNKFQASGFNAQTWLNNTLASNAFDGVLLLSDPDSGCNFDETTLRYFSGSAADEMAFLKINLFVRLWRKLGWTIEETDRALLAFVPRNTPFDKANLNKSPLKTTLLYLAHFKVLDEQLRAGKNSRLKLITIWSQLTTTGKNPLYAQLFLNHNVLKNDPVFDDPLGNYLYPTALATMAQSRWYEASLQNVASDKKIDPAAFSAHAEIALRYDALRQVQYLSYKGVLSDAAKANLVTLSPYSVLPKLLEEVQVKAREFTCIKGHLGTLQGALGLTSDEIDRILADAGYSMDSDLSLTSVSLLYRYGLLAKAHKLSIRDLISLKQLSGLDPFRPVSYDPVSTLLDDYPFTNTLRFVELAEEIKANSLKIEDLEFLLRHRFDPTGKYAPDQDAVSALLKTLADGVRAIRTEHALPEDTAALGEDFLRQKLGLVLPPDVLERFLAMLNGTVEFTATMTKVTSGEVLTQETFASEPAISQVSYSEARKEQKLSFRGMLLDSHKAQLKASFTSTVFASLLDNIQGMQKDFFKQNLGGFFEEFIDIFAMGPGALSTSEKVERLIWAIGPELAFSKPILMTEDLLQKNLKAILPSEVADTFLKMWSGTITYSAGRTGVEPESKLDSSAFIETNLVVSYDEGKKEQSLTYTGVLLDTVSEALKKKYPSPLLASLLDDILKQARDFFDQNLLGLCTSSDYNLLFEPIPSGLSEAEKEQRSQAKTKKLANAFLLFVLTVDKTLWEGDSLKQILKLVFSDSQVSDTFLKMWTGEIEYLAVKENVAIADKLDSGTFSEPNFTISYDTVNKKQTLTFKGVLLETQSAELKARYPSILFADLLADIERQAKEFYSQYLQEVFSKGSFNLLFKVLPDGLNNSLRQSLMGQKRTRLARAFLPFLQQQLIRQFILQTMTSQLGADSQLMEALLTDERLLGNPQPLLKAFAATGECGLTATFYASVDGSGAPLEVKLFTDADTSLQAKAGALLKPSGANSATFEGSLVVKTPGAYRFYVVLDKQDAQAKVCFDHLSDPLLDCAADSDKAEVSQYLELQPGVLYPFTLDVRKLGGGDARFMVQGETLPKGSLAQLILYPKAVIKRANHAWILLQKTLHLIQELNLSEREVRYLTTHAGDFEGLNLSKLPTREGDDTLARAMSLFKQFLRLAGYARLKRDLAGGTDDLIEIFETTELDKVYSLIARLTRRDQETVRATAEIIFTAPNFYNELALGRLWKALQVVERFGVPAASVAGWTQIVRGAFMPDGGFAIARDLKESIKARFEPETWQRMVRPIFDKLRQLQRDALIAHIMHRDGFARLEQLYEYFLIDPGMEPVVQTSRIRLASSSVQLFVHRCLLNLEPQVHPSVINTRQWEWMKRYRVWEANRKIFLFPENWLEPEFRDDKTHLFRELEGNLLQGDVSNDLVEDAFLNYLRKLDELARLDIVGMHCEVKAEVALNTLHVIGRTFSQPYKYFYRRYAHEMWTPWEPITAEIEGDHLAPVVWRDRLYLFWVTFLEKTDPKASATYLEVNPNDPNSSNKNLSNMNVSDMAKFMEQTIEAELHWSEYLQGEWSTRESSGFNTPKPLQVKLPISSAGFNKNSVLIHVSTEAGQENGVFIHLGGSINKAFYLAGRNSVPESKDYKAPPDMPYTKKGVLASRYTGEGALNVTFTERIITEAGKTIPSATITPYILEKGASYTLLPCDNSVKRGDPDFGYLITPIFYQDNANTLFMQPELRERKIEEWQEWVTRAPEHDHNWGKVDWLKDIVLQSVIPEFKRPILDDPGYPVWSNPIDSQANFKVNAETDWLVNSMTVLQFDNQLIGPNGRAEFSIQTKDEATVTVAAGGIPVDAHSGSNITTGSTLVAITGEALEQAGLTNTAGGINLVGFSGLNSALLQNLNKQMGSVRTR